MEIWIKDENIIDRIVKSIIELSDDRKTKYEMSNISEKIKSVCNKEITLSQDLVFDYCQLTNINYRYIVLGENPIYDTDNTNRLYQELIKEKNYTI